MDAGIAIALVNTAGVIAVGALQQLHRKDTTVVKDQVKNSHSTNLRHDIDLLGDKMDRLDTRLTEHIITAATTGRR